MLPRSAAWLTTTSLAVRITIFLWEVHAPLPFNSTIQNFLDFHGYYLVQLHFISLGQLPYRDFAYSYPPLFLYILYPFYKLSADAAAIPIVLADALCPALVYLLVRDRASERLAILAGIAYTISPFFIVYEGMSWLSEEPMLFLLLLSICLLQSGRWTTSAVSFALAVLAKQDALFVLPAYLYWSVALAGWKFFSRVLAPFVTVLGAISAPFLLIVPAQYLDYVSLGHFPASHLAPPFSGSGPLSIGGITSLSTVAPVPVLGCFQLGANFFGATYVCTDTVSHGALVSNFVVNNSPLANTVFSLLIPLLLLPAIVELGAIPKNLRFPFFFLVSDVTLAELLFLFNGLTSYKYYLIPAFALLLICAIDLPSLLLAAISPLLVLAIPYALAYRIVPIVAIQALAVIWLLRKKKLEATAAVRPEQSDLIEKTA